ncbi:MAG: hypothetical protein WC569_03895 [Candidatus Omnitrophota bacterium]
MRAQFFIPGGFVSFLIAFFIRLWALDNGHLLLAKLAFIYMVMLLIPVVVILFGLALAGFMLLMAVIFIRRKRF